MNAPALKHLSTSYYALNLSLENAASLNSLKIDLLSSMLPTSGILFTGKIGGEDMLRILFGFEGRIGRRNYWLAILGQWMILGAMFAAFNTALIAMFATIGVDLAPGATPPNVDQLSSSEQLFAGGIGIAALAFLVVVLGMSVYMSVAAQVKRLHDMNMSGWFTLLNFASLPIAMTLTASDPANAPIALFVMLIPIGLGFACGFFPGTYGPNQFGEDRLSIFDVSARTDESWADRAQAHRRALKDQQEASRDDAPAVEADTPRKRRAAQRAPAGSARKGFGKRGMA